MGRAIRRPPRVCQRLTGLARLVVRIRAVIVHVIENKRPSRIEGRDPVPVGRQGPQTDDQLIAGVGDAVVGDIDDEVLWSIIKLTCRNDDAAIAPGLAVSSQAGGGRPLDPDLQIRLRR